MKRLISILLALVLVMTTPVLVFAAGPSENYTGLAEGEGGTYYYENGKVASGYTGFQKGEDNKIYYVKDGKVQKSFSGLAAVNGKKYFVRKGIRQDQYTGFAAGDESGVKKYYVKKGVFQRDYTGVKKLKDKNGVEKRYYIKKGIYQYQFTGFAKIGESGNYFYIKKGKLQNDFTGLQKSKAGGRKYYVKDGVVRKDLTGVVKVGEKGFQYYIKKGKLIESYSGAAPDTKMNKWYHVKKGKVRKAFTGEYEADGFTYYAENGMIKESTFKYGGKARYVGSDSKVKTGIVVTRAGDYYYSVEKNQLVRVREGLFSYNGKNYYTDQGGKIRRNTIMTLNGKQYFAGSDGSLNVVNKVIYLTFDDGPGPYTEKLINILNKYGAKATFFVNANRSSYVYNIGKAYSTGHAIGNHTYSHDYSYCYSSSSNFWSDFDKCNGIIKQQTGTTTNLLRFPGGSSNHVSFSYCTGIMSSLASQCSSKGITYFDWNVDSNDAGGTTTSSGVYSNIVNGCSGRSSAVVLCHDIKGYTVDAIEDVIIWGQRNGYAFLPLTSSAPTAHHTIAN